MFSTIVSSANTSCSAFAALFSNVLCVFPAHVLSKWCCFPNLLVLCLFACVLQCVSSLHHVTFLYKITVQSNNKTFSVSNVKMFVQNSSCLQLIWCLRDVAVIATRSSHDRHHMTHVYYESLLGWTRECVTSVSANTICSQIQHTNTLSLYIQYELITMMSALQWWHHSSTPCLHLVPIADKCERGWNIQFTNRRGDWRLDDGKFIDEEMMVLSNKEQHVSPGAHVGSDCSLTATNSIKMSVHTTISRYSHSKNH